MWPADVPRLQPRRVSTLRLARIRVGWDWFQSMKARDREAFWRWVEAAFGCEAWQLSEDVRDGGLIVRRRK